MLFRSGFIPQLLINSLNHSFLLARSSQDVFLLPPSSAHETLVRAACFTWYGRKTIQNQKVVSSNHVGYLTDFFTLICSKNIHCLFNKY